MEKLLTQNEVNNLIELRKTIHTNPELAHAEFDTANTLMKFLGNKPDKVIHGIGGTGIAFIYNAHT